MKGYFKRDYETGKLKEPAKHPLSKGTLLKRFIFQEDGGIEAGPPAPA